jgi:1,4-alpha-glucan branching enzyme
MGNRGLAQAIDEPWNGLSHSMAITLPPLAGLIFSLESAQALTVLTDEI